MIHLDASFLIRALAEGTPQDRRLRAWLAAEEALGMSAVAWVQLATENPKDFRRFASAGLRLASD